MKNRGTDEGLNLVEIQADRFQVTFDHVKEKLNVKM